MGFTFDAEAFEVMKNYLDTLEKAYSATNEGREVVADIEARIAELILNQQEASKIVDVAFAQRIVEQLGYPEDMPKEEEATAKLERRLYRNSEGAKLGGVCSGLGTYFGVDPSFLRIGIFLPMVLWLALNAMDLDGLGDCFGSIFLMCVLLYFTLLIAVPMAKTPRQKMEMRGAKITASTIHQTFKDDVAASSEGSERSAGVWADVTYGIGRIIMFCIKALLILFAVIIGLVGIGLLIALFAVLFGGAAIELALLPLGGLVGISGTGYIALGLVVILLFVGLLGFILLSIAVGNKPERRAVTVISALLGITMLFFCIITARNLGTLTNHHNWERFEESFEMSEDVADELEDAIEDGDKVSVDYDDLTGRTQITIRNRHTGEEMVMELHENGMWVEKNTTTWEEKEVEQLEIVTDTLPTTPAISE